MDQQVAVSAIGQGRVIACHMVWPGRRMETIHAQDRIFTVAAAILGAAATA